MQFTHPLQISLAKQALSDIASLLEDDAELSVQQQGGGLLTGLAGQQLFFWQLHKQFPELACQQKFSERMALIEQQMPRLQSELAFGYGLTGIAWLYEFFLREGDYHTEFNHNTDVLLLQHLQDNNWTGELEFIRGLSGFSVYIAKRRTAELGLPLAKALLELLTRKWHDFADGTGTWNVAADSFFRFHPTSEKNEYNLGLAHGVPAIIAALLPLLAHQSLRTPVMALLQASCYWLLKQQQSSLQYGSCFSYLAGEPCQSRLGWCYGDATIALTLLRVGEALNLTDLTTAGKEIALQAAIRRLSDSQVHDAGICHGSAGLALIFHIMARYCSDTSLPQAAQYWFEHTLSLYQHQGLTGFNAVREQDNSAQRLPDHGLLGGYTGIGLVLLTALGVEANWLDALLME
ncbi:lanthionine synthetase LanC family protein [Shewanella sp.]|uniref:lanthionine synthetase LanC family protein n=1 Tax=Shewanella sp. TaxID=50422 RepID=UPI004053A034